MQHQEMSRSECYLKGLIFKAGQCGNRGGGGSPEMCPPRQYGHVLTPNMVLMWSHDQSLNNEMLKIKLPIKFA